MRYALPRRLRVVALQLANTTKSMLIYNNAYIAQINTFVTVFQTQLLVSKVRELVLQDGPS